MYSVKSAAAPTLLSSLATGPLAPTLLRLGLSTLLCRSSSSSAAAPTRVGIHYDGCQCFVSFDSARLASPTWRRYHDDDPLGIWGYLQSAIWGGDLDRASLGVRRSLRLGGTGWTEGISGCASRHYPLPLPGARPPRAGPWHIDVVVLVVTLPLDCFPGARIPSLLWPLLSLRLH